MRSWRCSFVTGEYFLGIDLQILLLLILWLKTYDNQTPFFASILDVAVFELIESLSFQLPTCLLTR